MSNDIERLRRDYREIEAPSHLATRIRASVADEPARHRAWIPAAATAAVAAVVVSLGPLLIERQEPGVQSPPRTPSFSMLSSVRVTKPPVRVPNLSSIRSVRPPPPPRKPRISPNRPQSFFDTDSDIQKETDHA